MKFIVLVCLISLLSSKSLASNELEKSEYCSLNKEYLEALFSIGRLYPEILEIEEAVNNAVSGNPSALNQARDKTHFYDLKFRQMKDMYSKLKQPHTAHSAVRSEFNVILGTWDKINNELLKLDNIQEKALAFRRLMNDIIELMDSIEIQAEQFVDILRDSNANTDQVWFATRNQLHLREASYLASKTLHASDELNNLVEKLDARVDIVTQAYNRLLRAKRGTGILVVRDAHARKDLKAVLKRIKELKSKLDKRVEHVDAFYKVKKVSESVTRMSRKILKNLASWQQLHIKLLNSFPC